MDSNSSCTAQFVAAKSERLDISISENLQIDDMRITRSQVKQLINQGQVFVDGSCIKKPAFIVEPGHRVSINVQQKKDDQAPYDFPLDILYQDDSILVINKPAGLTMHPGAGNPDKTLANAVLSYLISSVEEFPGNVRPGIVHRLDKDTTGVIVVARSAQAHAALSDQFAKRTTSRTYLALVAVTPRANRLVQREEAGTISSQIGRHPSNRMRQCVLDSGGKAAVTHWKRLVIHHYSALLELKLDTGRTHQIRVHMEHVRSPVVGDRTYGAIDFLPKDLQIVATSFGRQALHAQKLAFDHPVSGERMEFESAVPDDMKELIDRFSKSPLMF